MEDTFQNEESTLKVLKSDNNVNNNEEEEEEEKEERESHLWNHTQFKISGVWIQVQKDRITLNFKAEMNIKYKYNMKNVEIYPVS